MPSYIQRPNTQLHRDASGYSGIAQGFSKIFRIPNRRVLEWRRMSFITGVKLLSTGALNDSPGLLRVTKPLGASFQNETNRDSDNP